MRSLFLLAVAGCGALFASACSSRELQLEESSSQLVNAVADQAGDFGDVNVGMTSTLTVTVSQNGAGDRYDQVTAVTESCANFSVTPGALPREVSKTCLGGAEPQPVSLDPSDPKAAPPIYCGGGYEIVNYSFPVSFTPTVGGVQSCVISIDTTSGIKTITVTGNGVPPPVDINVSRRSIAFGDVLLNRESTPQAILVASVGSNSLAVESVAVDGAGFLLKSGSFPVDIRPNTAASFEVTCKPTSTSPISGTLTIVSNDPDEGRLVVSLTCRGIASALDVQPSPIAIPDARVNEPSTMDVVLTNTGTAPMDLKSIAVAGMGLNLQSIPSGTIPVGGSKTVTIGFLASEAMTVKGSLTVNFDTSSRAVPIDVDAKEASLGLNPDGEYNFRAVCVRTVSSKIITAQAIGKAPFTITDIAVSGAGFSTTTSGEIRLNGLGDASDIEVLAMPTVAGDLQGTLAITTNIPNSSVRMISLLGRAIDTGVGVAPVMFDFGSNQVNEPTEPQRIHLTNCTEGEISVLDATVTGENAEDFRVVTRPENPIQVNGQDSVLVELRPRTPGPKTATLVIRHSAGTLEVPLLGDGFLPPVKPDRFGTYYACSTGTSRGGGWLLMLGLAALVLRRRRR